MRIDTQRKPHLPGLRRSRCSMFVENAKVFQLEMIRPEFDTHPLNPYYTNCLSLKPSKHGKVRGYIQTYLETLCKRPGE